MRVITNEMSRIKPGIDNSRMSSVIMLITRQSLTESQSGIKRAYLAFESRCVSENTHVYRSMLISEKHAHRYLVTWLSCLLWKIPTRVNTQPNFPSPFPKNQWNRLLSPLELFKIEKNEKTSQPAWLYLQGERGRQCRHYIRRALASRFFSL